MDFNDIKNFIETNKDSNEELKTYLQGFNKVTVEGVQKFLNEDKDAKSWFDSERDKHAEKAKKTFEETFKTNELPKLLEAEIKKRYPEADPKDLKMKELEIEIQKMKQESFKKELSNTAIKTATEKQLPIQMIDFLLGTDLESTNKNIETFETILNDYVQKQVEARISGNSYVPNKGNNNNNSELQVLQTEYDNAMKASNMPLAIAIKNKMVALQNKK